MARVFGFLDWLASQSRSQSLRYPYLANKRSQPLGTRLLAARQVARMDNSTRLLSDQDEHCINKGK